MSERIEKLLEEILYQLKQQNEFLQQSPGDDNTLNLIYQEIHAMREMQEEFRRPPAPPIGKPVPLPPSMMFKPYDPITHLADLCKKRDVMREQLDGIESMAETLETQGGKNDMFAKMMRAQVLALGMPSALESIEEQISSLQRSIEEAEAVLADVPVADIVASPEAKQSGD